MGNTKPKNKLLLISLALFIFSCDLPTSDNKTIDQSEVSDIGYRKQGEAVPFFGPITMEEGDSVFYQVPKFFLTDQEGEGFGYSFFQDRIMVVDFFFTTCSTICPIMTTEMKALQDKLQADSLMGPVKFLSVTIDPEEDSPEVLKEYALKKGADLENWKFGTREIEYVDELSKKGFFLAVDRDASVQDGIIHSSQLILVDGNRNVRGSYDGIDTEEMARLYNDIKLLTGK